MGKLLDEIGPKEIDFIAKQKVFFVATSPLSEHGHVNVSPKAPGSSVIVIDHHTVAYADLSGSGAETAAHVLENQRMTLMFCNIEVGLPKIVRLHGKARVIIKENVSHDILSKFPAEIINSHGFRAIYWLDVQRISSSCGYSLPIMTYVKQRQTLNEFFQQKGSDGMFDYNVLKNSFSIDGLPSLGLLRHDAKTTTTTTNVTTNETKEQQQEDEEEKKENDDVSSSSKMIIPKPENGYVFGEIVSSSDKRAQEFLQDGNGGSNIESIQKTLKKYNMDNSQNDNGNNNNNSVLMMIIMVFVTGVIVGCLLTVFVLPHANEIFLSNGNGGEKIQDL